MNKNILTMIILVAFIGVALLVLFAGKFAHDDNSQLSAVTTDAFGGPFTLTDHTGKIVTDKTYAGQYQLIYFGFTYCPAICPTELSKIASALKILKEKSESIQPIFITIDPERDTVEVMEKYVDHFHPRLIGLTGSIEQIESIKKAYKVYATKVNNPELSDYTMDHSSYIYFMAPDGRLLSLFKTDDTAQSIAETVSKWLEKAS